MTFKNLYFLILLVFHCVVTKRIEANEKIVFVSTIPDLSWLAKEIGGDFVQTSSMLNGRQNPHYMDAVPEFVRLASRANVLCFVGLELEVGYLPSVLTRSGNKDIQKGGKGYCDASEYVHAIDKPTQHLDRASGDVHPDGNPHYYLSPTQMIQSAKKIQEVLINIDPKNSGVFKSNYAATRQRLLDLKNSIYAKFSDIHRYQKSNPSNLSAIEYHKEFEYFFREYDIKSSSSIEEIPGIAPTLIRIKNIANEASKKGVWILLNPDYNRTKTIERFSELSRIKSLSAPTMVQPDHGIKSYYELQNKIAKDILDLFRTRGSHDDRL